MQELNNDINFELVIHEDKRIFILVEKFQKEYEFTDSFI